MKIVLRKKRYRKKENRLRKKQKKKGERERNYVVIHPTKRNIVLEKTQKKNREKKQKARC